MPLSPSETQRWGPHTTTPLTPIFSLPQLQGEEREGDLCPGEQGLGEEVPAELPSQLLLHPQLVGQRRESPPRGMGYREGDPFAEAAAGTPRVAIAARQGHPPRGAAMTLTTSLKAKGLCHPQHPTGMGCADPVGRWGPDPLPAPVLSAPLRAQAAARTPRRQRQRVGEAALAGLAAAEGLRGSSSVVIFCTAH